MRLISWLRFNCIRNISPIGWEGDTCYISIRLEYDHEAMLENFSEDEIAEKRAHFQERITKVEGKWL